MFTFFKVVKFPTWVSHIVIVVSFCLSFDVILPIIIVELLPMSNGIHKLLRFIFHYGCLDIPVVSMSNDYFQFFPIWQDIKYLISYYTCVKYLFYCYFQLPSGTYYLAQRSTRSHILVHIMFYSSSSGQSRNCSHLPLMM